MSRLFAFIRLEVNLLRADGVMAKDRREMVDEAVNAVLHGSIDDKAALGAPGMWVHDPDEWERVRLKFGEAIEKLRGVPAELH